MTTETAATSTDLEVLSPQQLGIIEQLGIKLADPETIQWRIAERLATANSLGDLLGENGPQGLRDHIGEKFQIRDVEYLPSAKKKGQVYALINAVNADGEPVTFTSGALSVVIQLARGMQMGWWQGEWVKAKWSTDEPSADGNRPYMLATA
jgi:hypothetical protein